MAYYSCMAIGINRYRHIQPLKYAQEDAEAIQHFLVKEAELLFPQECLLLTDASPWIGEQPTYPNRTNILKWLSGEYDIEWQSVAPKVLWFFFSGYGILWQDQDYLMPIDGDAKEPQTTGIKTEELFNALQDQGAEKIVVFLDINRSATKLPGSLLGQKTIELAQSMGISLVLSCQPEEIAHECHGHGIFTAAMLETLRYYRQNLTLANLEQYLSNRLPELSEHHRQTPQHPAFVIPSLETSNQLILPQPAQEKLNLSATSSSDTTALSYSSSNSADNSLNSHEGASVAGNGSRSSKTSTSSVLDKPVNTSVVNMSTNNSPEEKPQSSTVNNPPDEMLSEPEGIPLWQEWLIWGGSGLLVVAAIAAGLLFSKKDAPVQVQKPVEPGVTEVLPGGESPAQEAEQQPTAEAPDAKKQAQEQAQEQKQAATAQNEKNSDTAEATKPETKPETKPKEEEEQTTAIAPAAVPALGTVEGNQAILERARSYTDGNQATGFKRAIEEASQIPRGTPLYKQAAKDINRWRLVILDIAQGRAAKGNFATAIAAAELITEDDPSLYETSRQFVGEWKTKAQQQKQNQAVIQKAKGMIISNQASSYNRAIEHLRIIKPEQPSYGEARDLSEQWSQQIYLIANSRASRGNFSQALQTAKLVPTDSAAYENAKKAIARWKAGQR